MVSSFCALATRTVAPALSLFFALSVAALGPHKFLAGSAPASFNAASLLETEITVLRLRTIPSTRRASGLRVSVGAVCPPGDKLSWPNSHFAKIWTMEVTIDQAHG